MISFRIGECEVDILPVVNGLVSEADKVRESYGKYESYGASMGIEALEAFFRRIDMPTNLRELGVNPTEEEYAAMAHKCAVGVNGGKGSARMLYEEDMLAIYKASL